MAAVAEPQAPQVQTIEQSKVEKGISIGAAPYDGQFLRSSGRAEPEQQVHGCWPYTLQKPAKVKGSGKLIQNVEEIKILGTVFSADMSYANNTEKRIQACCQAMQSPVSWLHIDGLAQDCSNSSALTTE